MTTSPADDQDVKPCQPRRAERRVCNEMTPPPFAAAEGQVAEDRRTHVDRRAAWLREYTLKLEHND
ncbi:hypothetical protein [Dechloromonas sp.]|uniref:hypothetical protein n=1 Tax=Dechloromonas sp. TaxID=1917218 RepID=UPI001217A74F|nr:hypothetical protein [Dechloromonas sp.]MBU3698010.1 hypothetical protein [Dechloromonas sp.]TEX49524.1 MAG: hypothetical protein CFR70_02170 [Rhodocyclaceae bacterium]